MSNKYHLQLLKIWMEFWQSCFKDHQMIANEIVHQWMLRSHHRDIVLSQKKTIQQTIPNSPNCFDNLWKRIKKAVVCYSVFSLFNKQTDFVLCLQLYTLQICTKVNLFFKVSLWTPPKKAKMLGSLLGEEIKVSGLSKTVGLSKTITKLTDLTNIMKYVKLKETVF